MTFALWQPTVPKLALEHYSDDERKIGRRMCWNLSGVQAALAAGRVSLAPSTTAAEDMQFDLQWSPSDLLAFFKCLTPGRYEGSQWCYFSKTAKKQIAHAADVYRMGFNKVEGKENQRREPWVYFKYSVNAASTTVLVHSVHPERFK